MRNAPLIIEKAPSTFDPSAGAAEPAPPGKLWYQGVGPDNTTTWVTSNLEKAKIFAKRRGKGRINVYTSDQIGEGAFADNEGNLMSPEDYIRKQSEDTTIQTLQHGLGRVELPEPIQVLDSDGKPVAPETPAPEPTKAPTQPEVVPTPQAQTQSGTPNFEVTPEQLGVGSPVPKFLQGAIDTILSGKGSFQFGRLADAIKETWQAAMNRTFPRITNADRISGEQAARWVSARAAAKYLSNVFAAQVVEGLNLDPAKFGAALSEDNLRSVRAGHAAAGDLAAAADVKTLVGGPKSPFKTEAEYQAYLNDPAVKIAIARHKSLWADSVDSLYKQAQGIDPDEVLPPRGEQTGARVNLFSPKDEVDDEPKRNMVQGISRGNLTGTMRRQSPFARRATGAGHTYNTNYFDMMANTFGRQMEIASKNAFEDRLVESGNAIIANSHERPTMPDGEGTTEFPSKKVGIVIKDENGQPRPFQINRSIYVRNRLAGEYRNAANVDLNQVPWAMKILSRGFNNAALAGLTESTFHLSNLMGALFTRPSVAGNAIMDTALSLLGRSDAPVIVTKAIIKSMGDNEKQLSELAEIGALRSEYPSRNPIAKTIRVMDKTTRLVLDDAYKKMVEGGWVEDNETNRREFVNQIGQYNIKAQNNALRMGRNWGVSPFATAGTTFNNLGIKMATMNPGVKASSMPAALMLRANVAAKWVGGVALVTSLNYMLTGKAGGRPGTPLGNVDLGRNNANGQPVSVPLFDFLGLGRALRVTGIRGAVTAHMNGLTTSDIVDSAGRDVINSQLSPWAGPAVRFTAGVTNQSVGIGLPPPNPIVPSGESQIASNIKESAISANPILGSLRAGYKAGGNESDALNLQLGKFKLAAGKPADFMANYPMIVHKAQLGNFTDNIIMRARQLEPGAQREFLNQAFSRIPIEDWPKTTKELMYRRIPYSPYMQSPRPVPLQN